jgi:hypothetical protein
VRLHTTEDRIDSALHRLANAQDRYTHVLTARPSEIANQAGYNGRHLRQYVRLALYGREGDDHHAAIPGLVARGMVDVLAKPRGRDFHYVIRVLDGYASQSASGPAEREAATRGPRVGQPEAETRGPRAATRGPRAVARASTHKRPSESESVTDIEDEDDPDPDLNPALISKVQDLIPDLNPKTDGPGIADLERTFGPEAIVRLAKQARARGHPPLRLFRCWEKDHGKAEATLVRLGYR